MSSPWERDDWMPERTGPFPIAGRRSIPGSASPTAEVAERPPAPPAEAREDVTPSHRGPGHRFRVGVGPAAVVAALVALVIAVVVVAVAPGNSHRRTGVEPDDAVASVPPGNVDAELDAAGSRSVGDSVEAATDRGGTGEVLAASGLSLMVAVQPPTDVAAATVGEPPDWTRWTMALPEPLSTVTTPTEVVVLAGSDLHRIEVPSGRTRSLRIDAAGPGSHLAVTDGAIAVTTYSQVIVVHDDHPVRSTSVTGGIVAIEPRPSRSQFVVTVRPDEADALVAQLVGADGSPAPTASALLETTSAWDRWILPTGEIAVNEPGGVYVLADDGTASRISDGRLLAVGRNHLLLLDCDESAVCTATLDDARTGDARQAELGGLDPYLHADTAMRISPDGSRIVFADWQRPVGIWRVLDTTTGRLDDLDQLDDLRHTDTWMADSAGLFSIDAQQLTYHPIVGPSVTVVGLGPIRSVTTTAPTPLSDLAGGDAATTL